MAQTTIEWTGKVWNPVSGCTKVSRGCKNCYAEVMHKRLGGMGQVKYQQPFLKGARPWEPDLFKPFEWKKPDFIFPTSMSDLFHVGIPLEYIAKCYAVMFLTPHLVYQMLTKRPERRLDVFSKQLYPFLNLIHKYVNEFNVTQIGCGDPDQYSWDDICKAFPFKNIWEGTSIEDEKSKHERLPKLLATPAALRWVSLEPMVGPVDISDIVYEGQLYNPLTGVGDHHPSMNRARIGWVVAGGESGRRTQPTHPNWFRNLRDKCKEANVPFFFKQWGAWLPTTAPMCKIRGWIYEDGTFSIEHASINGETGVLTYKVGKKIAGNQLDGVIHKQFPIIK